MKSYRQRVAVQMQPMKQKQKQEKPKTPSKKRYPEVKAFLLKAIRMYEEVSKKFEPLSDEWETCISDLQKYKIDYELLETGTHEERKGVIEKYGG